MGATAASGGYYIGVYADRLVAYPTTLTGSIGVVGVFPHIEGLLEQQKIAWDVVKEHEQADMGALYRELSDGERSKLQGAIMHKYERFISAVSEGRGMERDEVDEVARGRVWSGRQAAQRGLVDELGGIDTALAALQEEIGTDQPLELRDYTYRGVFPTLRLGSFSSGLLAALHPSPWPAELTELSPAVRSAYLRLLNGEQGLHDYVLTMMPYRFPEITGEGPLP
jgi:protease-4